MFLDKKVKVKIPKRDSKGKLTNEYVEITGICQLEPVSNPILGIPLQTVVDRVPVELKSINDIKIV
jgi:hypothetical protein